MVKMQAGYTITEIMVVVILVGIIASFGLPQYTKSVNRAKVRDVVSNLKIFHAANQIYRARQGSYYPSAQEKNLATINTALSINVIANDDAEYWCEAAAGNCIQGSASCCRGRVNSSASWIYVRADSPLQSGDAVANNNNPCCSTDDVSCEADIYACTN